MTQSRAGAQATEDTEEDWMIGLSALGEVSGWTLCYKDDGHGGIGLVVTFLNRRERRERSGRVAEVTQSRAGAQATEGTEED